MKVKYKINGFVAKDTVGTFFYYKEPQKNDEIDKKYGLHYKKSWPNEAINIKAQRGLEEGEIVPVILIIQEASDDKNS